MSDIREGAAGCAAARLLLHARIGRRADQMAGDDALLDPALLEHLMVCGPCRAEALGAEPSLLFALAAIDPPKPDWTGFNEAVLADVERGGRVSGLLGRLLGPGILAPRRLVPALAAAGSLAVLALIVWHSGFLQPSTSVPLTAGTAGTSEDRRGAAGHVADGRGLIAGVLPSPVETIDSPTARVIQMRIGGESPFAAPDGITGSAADSSDFVMILDEGIDL